MGKEIVERRGEQRSWKHAFDSVLAGFEHAIVENGEGVPECTIFPHDCEDDEIVTHWITASGDAFVALDVVR